MSILIRGMEMPKNCFLCPLSVLQGERLFCEQTKDEVVRAKIDSDCPLISIPPHGRLIEDTVLDNMSMWNTDREYDRGWDSAVQAAKNRLRTAPTIIEAEVDE